MLRVTSILLVMLSSATAHAQFSMWGGVAEGMANAQIEDDLLRQCRAGQRYSCYELQARRQRVEDERRHRELVDAIRSSRR